MTNEDRIYVGYLPIPVRFAALLKIVVPVLIGSAFGLSIAIAATSGPTGNGHWDTSEEIAVTGTLRELPYPHIETGNGPALIVEIGKFGAAERADGLDGHYVQATGTSISRGDWRMLELVSLGKTDGGTEPTAHSFRGEPVTAVGEIVDSKCYLGAMMPGDGRTHKACAILCIHGGIPPLFVGTTQDGQAVAAVVTNADGAPMPHSLLDFVGEQVELNGTLGTHGSLPTFRVSDDGVRRIR